MRKSKSESADNSSIHNCISFRDGDWIIYVCPHCGYEHRENWRTGESRARKATPGIKHFGAYYPYEYQEAFQDTN